MGKIERIVQKRMNQEIVSFVALTDIGLFELDLNKTSLELKNYRSHLIDTSSVKDIHLDASYVYLLSN